MGEKPKKRLGEQLKDALDATISWSARTVIPVTALVSIIHAHQTGTSLPPALELIAAGVGANTLASILSKFDQTNDARQRQVLEEALREVLDEVKLEIRLGDDEFRKDVTKLLQRFDVLGTAMQIHENSIVNRILRGGSYHKDIGSQVIEQLHLYRDALSRLNPEFRYLTNLIHSLEGREGPLEYVDMKGLISTQVDGKHQLAPQKRKLIDPAYAYIRQRQNSSEVGTFSSQSNQPLSSVLEALGSALPLALVGPPGAGKTTTLRRIALDAAWRRMHDASQPLTYLKDLSLWRDQDTLEQFLLSGWVLDLDLTVGLVEGQILLLLDGLNEMGASGDGKISRLKDWLHGANSPVRAVIACRDQNYFRDEKLNLKIDTVQIEPLDEIKIQQFAENYLGTLATPFVDGFLQLPKSGREPQSKLVQFSRNPFILRLLILIYESSPQTIAPSNYVSIIEALINCLWTRETSRGTTIDLTMEAVLDAYSKLAFNIFSSNRSTHLQTDYVVKQLGATNTEFGLNSGFLIQENKNVRFFHQLISEYLAARWARRSGYFLEKNSPALRQPYHWEKVLEMYSNIADDVSEVVEGLLEYEHYPLAASCALCSEQERLVQFTLNRLLGELEAHVRDEHYAAEMSRLGDYGRESLEGLEWDSRANHLSSKGDSLSRAIAAFSTKSVAPLLAVVDRTGGLAGRHASRVLGMIGAKSLDLLTTMLPNAFLHRGYVISEAIMEMRAEIAVFPELVLDWYVSQLNRNDIEPWSGYSYSSLIAERIAGTSDEAARSSLISWCRAQINSRVAENQMNAAKILSKISRSPSQQTIIRLWKKLLPSKFWQTASAALREIGNLEAIEILEEWWIPRLSDTSTPRYDYEGVIQGYGYKAWQHYASRELERIATPKAIKSLVQYWSESLKRGSLYGSREAIEALQRIDSTEARNALAEWKSRNRL